MRARDKQVNIRITEKEYLRIKKKADMSKKTFSNFVISASLDKNVVVINEVRPFVHQLSKIGNNLNQLTVLCHQGKIQCLDLKETKGSIAGIYSVLLDISDPDKK